MKLHLAVDADSHQIVASLVTSDKFGDGEILPDLLAQVTDPIGRVYGDGAYDTHGCHDAISACGAEPVIPPRDNAAPWEDGHPRTEALRQCVEQGDAAWKKSSGYHRRSLAETAMFRFKQIIGSCLAARDFDRQDAEAQAGVAVLNKMSTLGMPVRIAAT